MKLVVGLGNPGRRYRRTRHNVGFRVLERLAERLDLELEPRRDLLGRFARGPAPGGDVALLAPETLMNRSGASVARALERLPPLEVSRALLVVLDDLDLPLGRLRLRAAGGAGGHRGLADVIDRLESRKLPRLRFGIGRPAPGVDPVAHVLEPFSQEQELELAAALPRAVDAVECFLAHDVATAMNRFNVAPAPQAEEPPGAA